jgi:hypothetical protein
MAERMLRVVRQDNVMFEMHLGQTEQVATSVDGPDVRIECTVADPERQRAEGEAAIDKPKKKSPAKKSAAKKTAAKKSTATKTTATKSSAKAGSTAGRKTGTSTGAEGTPGSGGSGSISG